MKPEKLAKSKGYVITKEGVVISPYGNKVGTYGKNKYLYFSIRYDNKIRKVFFHRFQAYNKFGDIIFDNNLCVRHLNGNFLDNSYNNIEIGSYSQNSLDIPVETRKRTAKYANMKYNEEIVKRIKEDRQKGLSYKNLLLKYNIRSKGSLFYIINKR